MAADLSMIDIVGTDNEMFIRRVQQGISTFEAVYTPHRSWPRPGSRSPTSTPLSVVILDSSFNPPTRAHLALAAAPPPPSAGSPRYDARLLLLSVRNADKQLKPGDAKYEQRLHMMKILATDLSDAVADANVAVGVIDAPTFVAKASTLQDAIRARLSDSEPFTRPRLTFLQGTDTLERFLAVRYYGSEDAMRASLLQFFSPAKDNAAIVCARRTMGGAPAVTPEDEAERSLLEAVGDYLAAGRIAVTNIGDTVQHLSSSEVREKVQMGDQSWRDSVTERIAAYIEEQNLYRTA